jgi:hypothetical protein
MLKDTLRIAAYNVENLFSRPRAFNQPESVAAEVLDAHARVNELFEHDTYTEADKAEILKLLGFFLEHPRFDAHLIPCDRCAFRRGVERSTWPRLLRVGVDQGGA